MQKIFNENEMPQAYRGVYERYTKRILDLLCALAAILVFGWLIGIVALLVYTKLGSPVLFKQPRPGKADPKSGKETVFYMYKFRTMSNETDEDGNLLPDEKRLGSFGKWLRATSLDELPELFNIVKGEMSLVGPRPQLVRDMVFMTDTQRLRHTIRPGLTGLAQVHGRNGIDWQEKLDWDLKYLEKVSFTQDIKILLLTVSTALIHKEGITAQDMATSLDYGDWLLSCHKISQEEYQHKQQEALQILKTGNADFPFLASQSVACDASWNVPEDLVRPAAMQPEGNAPYSVLMSLYEKESPVYLAQALDSMIFQSLPPDEIVLVLDGPLGSDLMDVVSEYTLNYPQMVHLVPCAQNQGLGKALNVGLAHCRNELVARMDTDDIAQKDRCQKQMDYMMTHPEVAIVGGQIEEFILDDPSQAIGRRIVPLTDEHLKDYMKKRCPFNHMTVMFRKSKILQAGNYQEWFWNEDYYLWIRLALEGMVFGNLEDVLVHVRTGPDLYRRRGGRPYFQSERNLQHFMLEKGLINQARCAMNVCERWILQVAMPNWMRSWVFRAFARS